MRQLLALAIGTIALGTAGPGSTQPARPALKPAEMHDLLLGYARCVGAKQPQLVSRFVLDPGRPWSVAGDSAYGKLGNAGCVRKAAGHDFRQMRITEAGAKGAFSEVAMERLDPIDAKTLATVAPLRGMSPPTMANFKPHKSMTREQFATLVADLSADAELARFGECVVRAAPVKARAYVLSKMNSASEAATISALQPAMGNCLSEGQIRLMPVQLRYSLATNYVRLAVAARPELAERLF